MKPKKSQQASLEKMKFIYFEIGLIISLSITLIAFEWTNSSGISSSEFENVKHGMIENEIIPITRHDEYKPTPPPPLKVIDCIMIVDDQVELDEELFLEDAEITMETEVELMEYKNYDEVDEEIEDEEIFTIVEDMPSFQDRGIVGFHEWISQNIVYPKNAVESGISGKVFISFVVEVDGTINNVKIIRGVYPDLDEEALRVVASSPKWIPGKQRGKPVRVSYTIPINFKFTSID